MRRTRLVQVVIVTAVLLVGGGALALAATQGGSAADRPFHGSPVPAMYPRAEVAALAPALRAAETRGHRLAKAWLDAHPITTDAAFAAWAVRAIGPPPGPAPTHRELAWLERLARGRGAQDAATAAWLEAHGKKQPWKVFRKQLEPFVDAGSYGAAKAALKRSFALGERLQAAAKVRYGRPSPYVADPRVHALNQARFAGRSRQSYPSKHTVLAGVALAVLVPLEPPRAPELRWWADQIAFSRALAGGHYPSDLAAGLELGTLVGDYERRVAGLDG